MARRKPNKNRKQVKRQTRHFQLRVEHPIDQHVREVLDYKRAQRSEVTTIRDGVRLIWALENNDLSANRPPIVENASEAFNRDRDAVGKGDNHFYMVTWWGDEPAGFTRFEFTGVVSGGYEIELNDEGRKSTRALESDELVLVFQQF